MRTISKNFPPNLPVLLAYISAQKCLSATLRAHKTIEITSEESAPNHVFQPKNQQQSNKNIGRRKHRMILTTHGGKLLFFQRIVFSLISKVKCVSLTKFFPDRFCLDEREDAMKKCAKLRAQPPPLYNEQRLLEQPIPNIDEPVNELVEESKSTEQHIKQEIVELNADDFEKMVQIMDDNNDQTEQEGLEPNEPIMDNSSPAEESLQSSNACGSENDSNDLPEQENLNPNYSMIINEPIFDEPIIDETTINELVLTEDPLDLSNAVGSKDDSDIMLLSFDGEFPQPIQASNDDIIKRENDIISGKMSFADRVHIFFNQLTNHGIFFIFNQLPFNFYYRLQENGDRIYLVGEQKRIIPKLVLGRIREWGAEPYKTSPKYDEKVVQLLLVSVYTATSFVRIATVDDCVRDFINGMCLYRIYCI